jgi:hypothetical protein
MMMKGSYISTKQFSRRLSRFVFDTNVIVSNRNAPIVVRLLSASSLPKQQNGLTPEGEVVTDGKNPLSSPQHEVVRFPSSKPSKQQPIIVSTTSDKDESVPVLLNSKEHAVGYLSKILNARVYDAAIETELQEAKNLSSVCIFKKMILFFNVTIAYSRFHLSLPYAHFFHMFDDVVLCTIQSI